MRKFSLKKIINFVLTLHFFNFAQGDEIITINQSESNDNMEQEQHHLIEEITEEPIEVSSDIKEEELHQFLPTRKRKIRTKKTQNNAKLLKTEENSTQTQTQTQNVIESTENGITIKTEKICPIAKTEESLSKFSIRLD